jgi:tetratricopeptide (TPR) repeat protein
MKCYTTPPMLLALRQCVALTLMSMSTAAVALTGSRFSQIVLPLPPQKKFSHEFDKSDNTLNLFFPDSAPSELEAFENYDETLARRVLIKDLGSRGTVIKIILRDPQVQSLVSKFSDPSRVVVDLFNKNSKELRDPNTGLPNQLLGGIEQNTGNLPNAPADMQGSNPQTLETPKLAKQLIQKMAPEATSPNELAKIISGIPTGPGKAWASFPTYIYRMQLAPIEETEKSKRTPIKDFEAKALSTSEAMADYAAKLFDLGHEGRALAAYQQVLQKDPEIFERDVFHLWRLAESHLGVGNLTLAEGYYQTLLDKHPDHLMSRFSSLRKLDVQAIRAVNDGQLNQLARLNEAVIKIPTRGNSELQALITIRNVWWQDSTIDQKSRTALASCDETTELELTKLLPNIENPKTAYLSSAMIAKRMSDPNNVWQNNYASWLGTFFDRYRSATDPITVELSQSTRQKITDQFQNLFINNQMLDVVGLYEQLPKPMKSITKDPSVSWQIAESYRSLGQPDRALDFYEKILTSSNVPAPLQFTAHYWIAAISSRKVASLKQNPSNERRANQQQSRSRKHDQAMQKIWDQLTPDQRNKLTTGLGREFKELTASETPLRTPAKIILQQYKTVLSENPPKIEGTPGTNTTDWLGNFSPSTATVKLLDDLGRKFAELGMPQERREALQLMRFIKPTELAQDKAAAKIWADEMTKLAETYRKADEFLEAGEIYTQIGEVAALDDSRAESFYKGGLLLFRAGKKEEAIKALEKAKEDPNNLFYSKLATERLNQLAH